ncbi:MAG: MFS transporter [Bacteroidales bacterium]|nr:MFS transporter [Bacteroidales bacterium]
MTSKSKVLPVLYGFFVMGFCDVVGIATSYAKADFSLSETVAGLIPSMVFIWFFLLSVPAAVLMDRLGRKKMVQISNLITFAGMLVPFFHYNFATCMIGFVFLGIGNTILQVSLNPLLTNVVKGDALTSSLTAGQVVKAVSSFCGPFIAAFAASTLGNWKYIFPIFAAFTLIAGIWLMLTHIDEQEASGKQSSFASVTSLLGDGKILMLFMGIFCIVGVDVGINTVAPKLFIERLGWAVETAGLASSVYFICRTAGALLGTALLARMKDETYFKVNIAAAIAALAALFPVCGKTGMFILIGAVGFFCSSIFSVIFSEALQARPDQANGISGLMIMGVCGGAVIPPLMGVLTDTIGTQAGSLIVITACALYLAFLAFRKRS